MSMQDVDSANNSLRGNHSRARITEVTAPTMVCRGHMCVSHQNKRQALNPFPLQRVHLVLLGSDKLLT